MADIIAGDYGFDPNRLAHRLLVIRLEEIEKIIARSPQHNLFKLNKGDSLSGLFVRLYNYLSNDLLVNSSIKVIRHNHESLRGVLKRPLQRFTFSCLQFYTVILQWVTRRAT